MRDKEFDQLFKNRFEALEVQPSDGLWNHIAQKLKPVKKRVFPVYWAAAALGLIVLSIALMAPDQEKIRLHGAAVVEAKTVPAAETQRTEAPAVETVTENETGGDESTALVIAPRLDEAAAEKEFRAMQPKPVPVRPVVKEDITVNAGRAEEPALSDENRIIAQAEVPEELNNDVITEAEPVTTKGIRNVGDLVNYVVDKVDKRANKFLKFNTDDDNSSLIGINIGFIKLNSKRHK